MSLTLPTPPRSSVGKENRPSTPTVTQASSPRKSIEWATNKEVFTYCPVSGRALKTPSAARGPRKSILKPSRPSLPFAQEKLRDITPLPENALENARYLEYPISMIVAQDSSLRELTEAYSILAARIRQSVPPSFFSSPTCNTYHLLFDPLRREAEPLSKTIVRDLGRIFVDPFVPPNSPPATPTKLQNPSLPTPHDSPASRKGGMNEEQVKYARDLSTVTSASLKFLTMAFQVPAIYNVFSKKQLNAILTAILAIPLAKSIRSPTARKICGLAISTLLSQRLPDCILTGAAPRIAFALKRAIEGELGREGKKGATAEAFRAVHDLSIYRPGIFIPIFHVYLTTLLDGLLTPSAALRVLAAHALGGFVLGITQAEHSFKDILRDISPVVSDFFLRKDPEANAQTTILRTLRTALRTTDPPHHAQGPFWAMSVLASLIILLGPALLKDRQLLVAFRGTIDIGLKAKKRIVRAITSTLWGPLIWVWQRWRGSIADAAEEESDDVLESEKIKTCFSIMIRMTAHLPIGVSFIGALLGNNHASCRPEDLTLALRELRVAAHQGGESTQRALDMLDRFVNSREDAAFYEHWTDSFLGKLIPEKLLSVSPGLLTLEINVTALSPTVEDIVAAQPTPVDVRPLADEEKRDPLVWLGIKDAWMACIEQLEMSEHDAVHDVLIDIWTGLVRMGFASVQNDPASLIEYASQCAEVLISIFTNESVDLRERPEDAVPANAAGDTGIGSAANQRLKLVLVRALWTATIGALPATSVTGVWKPMIKFLIKFQHLLVPSDNSDPDSEDEALSEWSQLCAQVAAVASADITSLIWGHDWEWDAKTRARAWRGYARGWVEDSQGSWREAASILGVPFRTNAPWDMTGADLSSWSSLLAYAVEMATTDNVVVPDVLELVVSRIEDQHIISLSSTLRVADHLIGMLEKHIEECTELPNGLINFVHEILLTSYPLEPRNKVEAGWLLRALQSTISNCPASLIVELLEKLHDGLCMWIADECALFSADEYSNDVIPLFQTILVALEPLPPSTQILQSFSSLFASALQTDSETSVLSGEREEALSAFTDFWNNNCQALGVPKGGWSEGISHALKLAFPTSTCSDTVDMDLSMDMPCRSRNFISLDSDEEDELDVLPRTTTPRRRHASQLPLLASSSLACEHQTTFIPPTTTPKKLVKGSAIYSELAHAPRLPGLFDSLSSTNRSAFHPSYSRHSCTVSGSSTASDDAEKENVSPQTCKAANGLAFSGMKRATVDIDSSPLRAKRLRTETFGSDDSEDARAVEAVLHVGKPALQRSPLRLANVNAHVYLQTPSKLTRPRKWTSMNAVGKNQKAQNNGKSIKATRRVNRCAVDDDDDDDDDDGEYIPSSSDIESEEEIEPSSSSSPVGPFTPRASRRAEFSLAVTQDPTSDDIITSSSPTRKIRRLARAERLPANLKTSDVKMNDSSVPTARYSNWSVRA